MEYMIENNPIIHYDHQDRTQFSIDNQSNQSNESESEFKIVKPIVKKTSNINYIEKSKATLI